MGLWATDFTQIIPDLRFWRIWEMLSFGLVLLIDWLLLTCSCFIKLSKDTMTQYKLFWSKRFWIKPCHQTFVLSGSLVIISRLVCWHYLTADRRASWTADPLTQTRPRLNTKLPVWFTAARRGPERSAKRGAPWSADTTHTSGAKWWKNVGISI